MSRHAKRKRSPCQKLHTNEMRRHGLILGSSSAADVTKPMDPQAASKQRQKDTREAKVQQRLARASRKREGRLMEKVGEKDKVIISLKQAGVKA